MSDYPILQVLPKDVIGDEAMGSKTKFWFRRDTQQWLFKEAREGTGEDWAEKAASELAHIFDVSAATVELAEFEGRRGCASLSFLHPEEGEALIHGNEILAGIVLGYDRAKKFHQSDHTLENIEKAICKLFPAEAVHKGVLANLAGYLVLDALIGNTDRHHENWALLFQLKKVGDAADLKLQVAPSFDHASSLGRELLDPKRLNLLRSGAVGKYVRSGQGAIYLGTSDKHGANPLRLVEFGARQFPEYFLPTIRQLKQRSISDLQQVLNPVPAARMSETSKDFTKAFLAYTYEALTNLIE